MSASRSAAITVTAPSAVATPPTSSTVVRSRSQKSIRPRGLAAGRRRPAGPSTTASVVASRSAGCSSLAIPTQTASSSRPESRIQRIALKASRSVSSSPPKSAPAILSSASRGRALAQEAKGGRALVDAGNRAQLEHLAPAAGNEVGGLRLAARSPASAARPGPRRAAPRQCRAWIAPLSSSRIPSAASSSASSVSAKRRGPSSRPRTAGSAIGSSSPGSSSSKPWLPA